jgi:hypothetical protein
MNDESYRRQREFTRNPVHVRVTVRAEDGTEIDGHSEQLSLNGLFVRSEDGLPVGSRCHVTLTLGDGASRIEVAAEVAHAERGGMGIAFDEMEPDSFAHLKRLVLFNARDPDRVEAEIENHLGFKDRINP